MSFLCTIVELLLFGLFRIVRSAFVLQGLALGAALLSASMFLPQDTPGWLESVLRSSLMVSATLMGTALLLVATARRLDATHAAVADPLGRASAAVVGTALAALGALAYAGTSDLRMLWLEIVSQLEVAGFWSAMARGADPFAGILVLPMLAVLLVPALETATAFFLVVVPVPMVVLVAARSRCFATLLAMLVACQVGLVVASLLGADAFSRLVTQMISALATGADADVGRTAEMLRRAEGILASTASRQALTALGYVACLCLVWATGRSGTTGSGK